MPEFTNKCIDGHSDSIDQSCKILDAPAVPLVTPQVLSDARAKKDVEITRYDSFSVDFKTGTSKVSPDPTMLQQPSKICNSALDLVGRTPMVRLTRFQQKYGLKFELLAKCEFLSIGGSTKDRIGKKMIEEAEQSGRLHPGDTIVEATSGNTGVGLCLAAAVKGYRSLITLPEKMSQEKMNAMVALGAEIIRTPTEAAWHSLDSHIGLAVQLQQTLPNCHFLDQYLNPANPRAHYLGTAEEILYQCDNKVDLIVVPAGTGGAVSGIAAKVKERLPNCKIVAVDPKGSILAEPDSMNEDKRGQSYLVEGIGYDFIPSTLHRSLVDEWVKTDDDESLRLARELIRVEGLLVGGSSGSAIAGVLKVAHHLNPNDRCVVLLPDSARNYMTKFIADDWMIDNGFYKPVITPPIFGNRKVSDIQLPIPRTLMKDTSLKSAIDVMVKSDLHEVIIVDNEGHTIGLLPQNTILSALLSGRYMLESSVTNLMNTKFRKAYLDSRLVDVVRMLKLHSCVVIVNQSNIPIGIINTLDVLKEAGQHQ